MKLQWVPFRDSVETFLSTAGQDVEHELVSVFAQVLNQYVSTAATTVVNAANTEAAKLTASSAPTTPSK